MKIVASFLYQWIVFIPLFLVLTLITALVVMIMAPSSAAGFGAISRPSGGRGSPAGWRCAVSRQAGMNTSTPNSRTSSWPTTRRVRYLPDIRFLEAPHHMDAKKASAPSRSSGLPPRRLGTCSSITRAWPRGQRPSRRLRSISSAGYRW